MKTFAEAVKKVLDHEKIDQAVLAGFSMGTPIISKFYQLFPEKTSGLIVVDGSLRGFQISKEQWDQWMAPYRTDNYEDAARRFLQGMFPNPGSEKWVDEVSKVFLATPAHVLLSSGEAMYKKETWEAAKIEVPLLILNARNPMWNDDYIEFVKKVQPKTEFTWIEGSGHFVMLEKPKEVTEAIAKFAGGIKTPGAAKTAEWRALFDGKSMAGWRGYGKQSMPENGWKVEEGILKKVGGEKGGDIITVETFGDFELEFEWRVAEGANNGVKYLVTEGRPSAPGHEYQLVDDQKYPDAKKPTRSTASFYDVLPPLPAKPSKPAGQWNHSKIQVAGNQVEHWLNGVKVLEYELGSDALKKAIAASKFKNEKDFGEKIKGHIMLTDHGDEAWFRNLRVR
jgi:hypothetical protein